MPTAARLAVVPDPELAVTAPRGWELAGELATGASAIVMRLRGKRNRVAALKLGRWRHPDLRARFANEATVLRALGAPVTPTLIEEGAIDGLPYLVMELVPGETLATWMSDPRRAGHVGKIVAVLAQIAETLALVHRAGFVHRDLKPENVMLGDHGPRILDLGLARRPQDPDSTAITDVVGTVHYTAPEQIRAGDLADQRADLYSLGVIAFELLTGVPPFTGERRAIEYQHCNVKAPRVSRTRTVPRDLDDLIAQCMDKQPEARPPSAVDIALRLRRIFEELRTLPGVGPASARAADVMHPEHVAILWVDNHASGAATSVIAEHHGHVVRRMADGLLAVFASSELEQPAIAAHSAAQELAATHCVIVHVAMAVVRFPVDGAVGAYGDAIEAAELWSASPRAIGVTLTDDAARELGHRSRPPRLATERTSAPLVGRAPLIAEILGLIEQTRSRLITMSGGPGTGKTRVLDEIAAGLHAQRREVVHVRAWRGFLGELGDDTAVLTEISA
ncbi:MAG TPA: serine/threonine-protein kinase, partial [Kofleriaceae bacterium]|nr:serine/threonine-protein kinase [Kofleriaceae bacterium]